MLWFRTGGDHHHYSIPKDPSAVPEFVLLTLIGLLRGVRIVFEQLCGAQVVTTTIIIIDQCLIRSFHTCESRNVMIVFVRMCG